MNAQELQNQPHNQNPTDTIDVGTRLRALREEAGLTIRALAERCGLAVNTLSLIEHGKSSPSVSTLQQIARALDVPITAFFATAQLAQQVIYRRAGQSPQATFTHGQLADLGQGMRERLIEPLVVTLAPQASSGTALLVHPGQEFVYCLEGRIAYRVGAQHYLLEPGDSLLFESHLPHCWENPDPVPARALLVLCPTASREVPGAHHFDSPREPAGDSA